jgi:uncharacterized membrane protein YbhN (UPF0104 family)
MSAWRLSASEARVVLRTCSFIFIRFLLVGVFFAVVLLVLSLFYSEVRGNYLRYSAAGVFLVGAAVGLLSAAWVFVSYYLKRPE